MERVGQDLVSSVPERAVDDVTAALIAPPDLACRMCELETENARLRLLVSELLVANQKLREKAAPLRRDEQAA